LRVVKDLLGAAVIGADVLFGMAAPEVIRGLHAETRPHLYGTIAVYAVLLLLSLWVIASVARHLSGGGQKPAPRAAGYPFGGSR